MAENKMKQVAEMLGVEMGVPFKIKGYIYNPCKLTENTFVNSSGNTIYNRLFQLLIGELEIEQPILDDVEKRYLEGVLRPFKNRVVFVEKMYDDYSNVHEEEEYIEVSLKHHNFEYEDTLTFPFFKKDTMYKGMTPNKKYTLKELGLFQDD